MRAARSVHFLTARDGLDAQEDDGRMTNDVMTLDGRVGRLEETVTTGFAEVKGEIGQLKERMGGLEGRMGAIEGRMEGLEGRMTNLELGMEALNSKIDVTTESLRGDIHTVLERVVGLTDEMRRTTASVRREHEADRRIIHLALQNHGTRIAALENNRYGSDDILRGP